MKRITALLLGSALLLSACGRAKDDITAPVYEPAKLEIGKDPINIEYWSDIHQTTIDQTGIRKATNFIFGWIPVVGDLFLLPLDLVNVLLPPLTSIQRPELPKDGSWNDPKLIKVISSLKLAEGYIRIVPEGERENYKPDRCWLGLTKCPDEGFDFLTEARVYLTFSEPRQGLEAPIPASEKILLAEAEISKDYDKDTKTIHFRPTPMDLRSYLANYGNMQVKIVISGKPPRHKIYLDGKFRLNLALKLDN